MEQTQITERLQGELGDKILAVTDNFGQQAITVAPEHLIEALTFLRDQPDIDMNMLMDIGGVDYLDFGDDREWRFEVAYQLYSIDKNHRYRVKVAVTDDSVEVPTINELWRVANWMEREVYDMFGIRIAGHKNLRRILCHDDFQGHALRKDYPINKRQKLERPSEHLLPEDPEWA